MGISLGPGIGISRANAGSAAYSPIDLGASLLLWLDGQDTATLFTDTTEVTPTINGASVGRWKDKSGNARHADQATAGAKPTRSDTAINGACGLTLDGGDGLVAPTLGALGACEIWCVASFGAGTQILVENYELNPYYYILYYDGAGVNVSTVVGTPVGVALASSTAGIIRVVADSSLASGAARLSVDGTTVASGANAAIGATFDATTLRIGMRYSGVFGLVGAIGEIVAVNRTLTAGEATSLRTYLQDRWGTP